MFRALASAKLNVISGIADTCIADTILNSDDWMAEYGPVGSGVKGKSSAWKEGKLIFSELEDYNNGLLCAPHRE